MSFKRATAQRERCNAFTGCANFAAPPARDIRRHVRWFPAMMRTTVTAPDATLIDVLGSNLGLDHQLVGARDVLHNGFPSPITPPTVRAVTSWTRIIASGAVIFDF